MISTKSLSEKIIFSKIFIGVWFARKNYEMKKSEFGKCRRNPATSGCRCWIPAGIFWIRSDQWSYMARSWPFSGSGRILAVLARSGWIDSQIRPDLVGSRPFWPDRACLARIWLFSSRNLVRRWPDSGTCEFSVA